jgi:hypothetical protein
MLSSYEPTMEACCRGEESEPKDGRRDRNKAGVCGDVPRPDWMKLGVELRDRRGWWA